MCIATHSEQELYGFSKVAELEPTVPDDDNLSLENSDADCERYDSAKRLFERGMRTSPLFFTDNVIHVLLTASVGLNQALLNPMTTHLTPQIATHAHLIYHVNPDLQTLS